MEHQIIKSEAGEELVVLTRRQYDALLAAAGDPAAEDRVTGIIAAEREHEPSLPGWFAEAVAGAGGNALRGLRKHRAMSQAEVAAAVGITQGYYSDIERGAKSPTDDVLDRISDALGLDRTWLRELGRDRPAS